MESLRYGTIEVAFLSFRTSFGEVLLWGVFSSFLNVAPGEKYTRLSAEASRWSISWTEELRT
jgi:hypothetical protein